MSDGWYEGRCSRCGRETRVTRVDHPEFAEACLPCVDGLAEADATTDGGRR
jgi:hypothetical protein